MAFLSDSFLLLFRRFLMAGLDILVGTPGRVMDLSLDGVLRFDVLQKLVIDEFDEILNLGFRVQLTSILSMIRSKRQNILFSATMTEDVDALLDEFFEFPEEVSLAPSGTPLEKIKQDMYTKIIKYKTKISFDKIKLYSRKLLNFANLPHDVFQYHKSLDNYEELTFLYEKIKYLTRETYFIYEKIINELES